jgi:hypothetical protein
MSMYLELSRPAGDISRWEKIYKRLTLLNKFYPLKPQDSCKNVHYQREIESKSLKQKTENLYYLVRNNFVEQEVVFFGGYANLLYSRYMPKEDKSFVKKIPDFDVLAKDPELSAIILTEKLKDSGFKNVKMVKHDGVGEIIPEHIQIIVEKDTIAFIYKPIACHSYNIIHVGEEKKEVRVATIDTMLNFYLAFIYSDLEYYSVDRILCMANFLYKIQQKNRLNQQGLLKRFNLECLGKQPQLEDIRAEKAEMFKKLNGKNGTREYEMWFLKYNPVYKKNKSKMKQHSDVPEVISLKTQNLHTKTLKKTMKTIPKMKTMPTEKNISFSVQTKNKTKKYRKKENQQKKQKKENQQKNQKKYQGIIEPVFQY